METEIWKDIIGYEGLYQVSNLGRIKSRNFYRCSEERITNGSKRSDGYMQITLCKNNHPKRFTVHRLVALTFIPKECGKDFVNHKDENRSNNCADNLEWCTKSYNQLYSMNLHPERKELFTDNLRNKETGRIGSRYTQKGVSHKYHEKVLMCSKDGKILKEFENAAVAAYETNSNIGNLTECCKSNARTDRVRKRRMPRSCNGYVWVFKNTDIKSAFPHFLYK